MQAKFRFKSAFQFIKLAAIILALSLLMGCTANNSSQAENPAPSTPNPNVSFIDITGGYTVETQELLAKNEGQQIYGLLYRPAEAEGQRPVVIYAHGFGASYRNGEQYAQALAAQGYLVYCFDFRGGSESSRSEGSNLEMSIFTEQSDLEAVIAMLKEHPDVDSSNIFLLGASQGGMVAAMTAADNAEDIAGAVLLYPAFVLVDDARERFSSLDEVPETYQHIFMTVRRVYFERLFDYDVYSHIPNYTKDILLIHGDQDSIVPLSYSQKALEVYPSAKLEIIDGAGHGFYNEAAQQAIDLMSEYFSRHLNGEEMPANSADVNADNQGILIAYFSVVETDGTDTLANASRIATAGGLVGNCQFIAQAIQQAVGGDLLAIETVQDYPTSHQPLLDFAYEELRQNARPELASRIENLEDYDVIFLGYPNWNADLPMPLYTFLESYDFSGKTIIPFVTHGGNGFSRTISTIADLQPNANVLTDGLSISRNNAANSAQQAMDWAVEILP